MADHIHRVRRFFVRPAGVGLLTVLGVMMLVYGPVLFPGVRGTTPSDAPMFPSRLASYSWYAETLSEGDMAAATLLYQNGSGVELYDDPQAVLLSSDGRRYRRLGVAESMSIVTDQGDPAVSVLSPDGTFAVVGSADPTGSVEVVTLRDGSHRSVALGTASSGLPLAIGADGRSVLLAVSTASVDRYAEEQDLGLARLDLVTGTVRAYPDVRGVESAALSPDGTTLAVSGRRGVEIVDAATGAVRADLAMSSLHLDGDAWSPSGQTFAAVSDGEVVVVDVSTAQPSVRRVALTGLEGGSALGWRDESTVLVHGSTNGDENTSELHWIDVVTQQQTPFSSYAPGVTGAAFAEVDAARDLIPRWNVAQLPVERRPLPVPVAAAWALVAGVLAAAVTRIVWRVLEIPAQRRRSDSLNGSPRSPASTVELQPTPRDSDLDRNHG